MSEDKKKIEYDKETMKRLIDKETRRLEKLVDEDPVKAMQAIIAFYKALGYSSEEINELLKVKEEVVKEVPAILPEGVYTVPFEMKDEKFAEMVENIFETIMAGKCVYKSAVNMDDAMRTVMREKDTGVETILMVSCKDNENAMSLRQTLDWVLWETIKVVAVRRQKNAVEVGYVKLGLKPPPEKEKYFYHFQKTDGWTLERKGKR